MTESETWWLLAVLVLGACAMLATTMVSHGLRTVLATVVAVSELTALYVLYQRVQRRLRWIHELYWARNQEVSRSFRDEYDGEVEAEFNGRPAKFELAPGNRPHASSAVALACRAGFEFSITPRCYDYRLIQPIDLQGRDGAETGDLEIDAEFVCRTAAREALVGWLREPEVRACVVDLFRAGTTHQLAFTGGGSRGNIPHRGHGESQGRCRAIGVGASGHFARAGGGVMPAS